MDVLMAVGMFRDGRTGEVGGLSVSAGSAAFWIVAALLLVVIVLYRSMRKQIGRISFDESEGGEQRRVSRSERTAE
ncbi:hypothetical protein [Phytoactinopolyspora limicola]|uniref:hypothetical protein n=1 Tax=Phytoactinopolyspora limicola TaxID=2715536 RepID=UPI00140BBB13|nr:hypothetical protein [Phytoactinopolyspora limicola]